MRKVVKRTHFRDYQKTSHAILQTSLQWLIIYSNIKNSSQHVLFKDSSLTTLIYHFSLLTKNFQNTHSIPSNLKNKLSHLLAQFLAIFKDRDDWMSHLLEKIPLLIRWRRGEKTPNRTITPASENLYQTVYKSHRRKNFQFLTSSPNMPNPL